MVALGYAVFFGTIGLLFIVTLAIAALSVTMLIVSLPFRLVARIQQDIAIDRMRRKLYPEEY